MVGPSTLVLQGAEYTLFSKNLFVYCDLCGATSRTDWRHSPLINLHLSDRKVAIKGQFFEKKFKENEKSTTRTSLVVQGLRLCAPGWVHCSISGQGTRSLMPQLTPSTVKLNKTKFKKKIIDKKWRQYKQDFHWNLEIVLVVFRDWVMLKKVWLIQQTFIKRLLGIKHYDTCWVYKN